MRSSGWTRIISLNDAEDRFYRLTIWLITGGIFLFACVVVAVALGNGNRQLLKDGLDWGYDVAIYGVAALVFGRGKLAERYGALAVAAIWLVAGLHTLYDLSDKYLDPRPIEPWALSFSAVSAVVIALLIVAALFRFRHSVNDVVAATWISSRNDVISTVVYSSVSLAARLFPLRWPEYALDLFSAALAFQAAYAIVRKVRAAATSGMPSGPLVV